MFDSILDALATLVEVFEEVRLLLVLYLIMVREAFVASIGALTDGRDLVKENAAPDIAILYVVKAISSARNKAIDLPRVTHLVVLAPVARQVQLSLLRRRILPETHVVHDEWHVAAVATEHSHRLEVSLHEGSASHCQRKETRCQDNHDV